MDRKIKDKTGERDLLTVDHIEVLEGKMMFGKKQVGFVRSDRGSGSSTRDELLNFLENSVDIIRWLAIVRKHGCFYIFNSHSCQTDAYPDFDDISPVAVFAKDTTEFIKLCGCSKTNPNSLF